MQFLTVIGSGKTITVRRIRNDLKDRKEVLVSTNLAVDKGSVNLGTLMFALFSDLIEDESSKIPSKLEFRERQLMALIKRKRKPVALFINEAHDLHHKTLVGLKRFQEIVLEADSLLSIVLIGHPKLKVDLNRPSMEEIGGRITILQMDGIQGSETAYIEWLPSRYLGEETESTAVFTADAVEFMVETFSTPLQINHYAWCALVKAFRIGQKPVKRETLQEIVSGNLNSIEASLK